MVKWHSPEEAEAWWAELQELKGRINQLEQRLLRTTQAVYSAHILLNVNVAVVPPEKLGYVRDVAERYNKLVFKSQNESEMGKHLTDFVKEVQTYLQSG